MGFLDKVNAGISNAGSRLSQEADEASYNSKIHDQQRAKSKALEEAGNLMFEAYKSGKCEITSEVKDLFEKAKTCDAEIEKLEKEKEEMKEKAHQEREDRRAEVKAKDEEEKAKKEAEKAKKE
ncbi:hypothetical protein AR505_1053 [methanogenic archaeon ISO4-H5]|jgi:hypothetical protein|nr:hypothetical protein AR505_1053 [methanogenic archaeon ISO4-H5]